MRTYGGMLIKEAKSYAAKNPSELIIVIIAVDLTNAQSLGIIEEVSSDVNAMECSNMEVIVAGTKSDVKDGTRQI